MDAVILAGGKGARLRPYTNALPKPLVPVGDQAVLDIILLQLARYGFTRVTLCTGHLADLIEAYCGDGSRWGIEIAYTHEETPLNTAGALALIEDPAERFLVMNGDVLTTMDYRALLAAHEGSGAAATVACTERDLQVEFGVVHMDSAGDLAEWVEKPTYTNLVSMGIYVLEGSALTLIEKGESLGMPDLFERIRRHGDRVFCHRTDCYWLDIGRLDDYEKAHADFEGAREAFLGEGA